MPTDDITLSQRQRAEAAVLHTLLLQQEPWHTGNWLIYMAHDQPFECHSGAVHEALDHLVDTQVLTYRLPDFPSTNYHDRSYAIVKVLDSIERNEVNGN